MGRLTLKVPEAVERGLRELSLGNRVTMSDLATAALVLMFLRSVAEDDEVRAALQRVLERPV